MANALEAAIANAISLPAAKSRDPELSIFRMKAGAHDATFEFQRESRHASLHDAFHFLVHDAVQRGVAIAKMQHLPTPRSPPFIVGHPHLAASGIVDSLGHPAERGIVKSRRWLSMRKINDAVEAAGFDPVDFACRSPRSFVLAAGEFAVRADTASVGRAETGCDAV